MSMKIKLMFGLQRVVKLAEAGVTFLHCHIRNHDGTRETTYICTWDNMDQIAADWGRSVGAKHVTYIDIREAN